MTPSSVVPLPTPSAAPSPTRSLAVSAQGFLGGAPVTFVHHGQSVTFSMADDVWYLGDSAKPNQRLSRVALNFDGVAPWLLDDAKQYLAHRWLGQRASYGSARQSLVALKMLSDVMGRMFSGTAGDLTRHHGRRVADEFARQARVAVPIVANHAGRRRGDLTAALEQAGVRAPLSLSHLAGEINRFAKWLRRRPQLEAMDFAVELSRDIAWTDNRAGGADPASVISDDTLDALLNACDQEYVAYQEAVSAVDREPAIDPITGRGNMRFAIARRRLQFATNRAVMAQATRLQLLAARRAGAVALLPADVEVVKRPPVNEGEEAVVEVTMRAYKMHGALGAPERIPFPGYFGAVALDAITKAKALSAPMRAAALPEHQGLLFLQWGREKQDPDARGRARARSKGRAGPLAESRLQMFFNSESKTIPGLVQRYGIRGAEHLTLHKARHTMSTELSVQGASELTVARYLGHIVTPESNALMAKLFYIAGGTPAMRESMKDAMERGLVSGLEIEPSLRLATRIAGSEAEAARTPANELSYDEALRRVRQRRADINDDPLTEAQVLALLERGQVIQYTSYGGCVLPAKTGPCPTAEKCPVGTEPESTATADGMGCPWQVLMPHAREHLTSEVAMMERKIDWYQGKPEYSFWLARELRHVDIWRKQVARLDRMETASGRLSQ